MEGFFHPYFWNIMAPDHLVTGPDQQFMEIRFQQLSSFDHQNIFECRASTAAENMDGQVSSISLQLED